MDCVCCVPENNSITEAKLTMKKTKSKNKGTSDGMKDASIQEYFQSVPKESRSMPLPCNVKSVYVQALVDKLKSKISLFSQIQNVNSVFPLESD